MLLYRDTDLGYLIASGPFGVLADAVVAEVGIYVQALGVKVVRSKPQVTTLVEPRHQGVPIRDDHPLPDVKLAPLDEQRPFYVFLDDPFLALEGGAVRQELLEAAEESYAAPARLPTRLGDPNILLA
eukprot:scaffold647918_cov29-Prasinocladus_malaysianus.AAC.2